MINCPSHSGKKTHHQVNLSQLISYCNFLSSECTLATFLLSQSKVFPNSTHCSFTQYRSWYEQGGPVTIWVDILISSPTLFVELIQNEISHRFTFFEYLLFSMTFFSLSLDLDCWLPMAQILSSRNISRIKKSIDKIVSCFCWRYSYCW